MESFQKERENREASMVGGHLSLPITWLYFFFPCSFHPPSEEASSFPLPLPIFPGSSVLIPMSLRPEQPEGLSATLASHC